jgi:hypothetical protein
VIIEETLEQAVARFHAEIDAFKAKWLKNRQADQVQGRGRDGEAEWDEQFYMGGDQ